MVGRGGTLGEKDRGCLAPRISTVVYQQVLTFDVQVVHTGCKLQIHVSRLDGLLDRLSGWLVPFGLKALV
jgi:hypothetical protein